MRNVQGIFQSKDYADFMKRPMQNSTPYMVSNRSPNADLSLFEKWLGCRSAPGSITGGWRASSVGGRRRIYNPGFDRAIAALVSICGSRIALVIRPPEHAARPAFFGGSAGDTMRIAIRTIGALLAVVCFWSATSAQARPITYSFMVTTNENGTVSGQFTFDADDGPAGTYSNVALAVTNPGDAALDGTYTNVCPAADCPVFSPKAGRVVVLLNPPIANLLKGEPAIFLFFTPSLSDAIGPTNAEVLSGTCNNNTCGGANLEDGGFGSTTLMAAVPTLSGWSVGVFSLLLFGVAFVFVRPARRIVGTRAICLA